MKRHASFTQWALEPYCIGMKLRALRNRKRMTLARLSVETGLSTALLSKLETERMIPTLPTLATLCRVHGVSLSYFFREPETHLLAITRKAHLEGQGTHPSGVRATPLNAPQQSPCLLAQMVELTSAPFAPQDSGADVCAFLYVLEGRLHMHADGMAQTLEQGDCAFLETDMPLSWNAIGDHACRILLVQPGSQTARPNRKDAQEQPPFANSTDSLG